jgi:hypothetical protein
VSGRRARTSQKIITSYPFVSRRARLTQDTLERLGKPEYERRPDCYHELAKAIRNAKAFGPRYAWHRHAP